MARKVPDLVEENIRGYQYAIKQLRETGKVPRQEVMSSIDQLGKKISGNRGAFNDGVYELKNNPNFVAKEFRFPAESPFKEIRDGAWAEQTILNLIDSGKIKSPRIKKSVQLFNDGKRKFSIIEKGDGEVLENVSLKKFKNIPKKHLDNFEADIKELKKEGIGVDVNLGNFLYDDKNGIQFIDLLPDTKEYVYDSGKIIMRRLKAAMASRDSHKKQMKAIAEAERMQGQGREFLNYLSKYNDPMANQTAKMKGMTDFRNRQTVELPKRDNTSFAPLQSTTVPGLAGLQGDPKKTGNRSGQDGRPPFEAFYPRVGGVGTLNNQVFDYASQVVDEDKRGNIPSSIAEVMNHIWDYSGRPVVGHTDDQSYRATYNPTLVKYSTKDRGLIKVRENSISDVLAELAHSKQYKVDNTARGLNKNYKQVMEDAINKGEASYRGEKITLDMLGGNDEQRELVREASYKVPGTLEYNAHQVVQPELTRDFRDKTNRLFWRDHTTPIMPPVGFAPEGQFPVNHRPPEIQLTPEQEDIGALQLGKDLFDMEDRVPWTGRLTPWANRRDRDNEYRRAAEMFMRNLAHPDNWGGRKSQEQRDYEEYKRRQREEKNKIEQQGPDEIAPSPNPPYPDRPIPEDKPEEGPIPIQPPTSGGNQAPIEEPIPIQPTPEPVEPEPAEPVNPPEVESGEEVEKPDDGKIPVHPCYRIENGERIPMPKEWCDERMGEEGGDKTGRELDKDKYEIEEGGIKVQDGGKIMRKYQDGSTVGDSVPPEQLAKLEEWFSRAVQDNFKGDAKAATQYLSQQYPQEMKVLLQGANPRATQTDPPVEGGNPAGEVPVIMGQRGIPTSENGLHEYPNQPVYVPSNQITMAGILDDVLGIADTGEMKLMKPNEEHKFKGAEGVLELPMDNGVLAALLSGRFDIKDDKERDKMADHISEKLLSTILGNRGTGFKAADGGFVGKPQYGVPIQTEKIKGNPEQIIWESGLITDVNAEDSHKNMQKNGDGDVVTDMPTEGGFITSAYGGIKISKKDAESIKTGLKTYPYSEHNKGKAPEEFNMADELFKGNEKYITPAVASDRVKNKFKTVEDVDVFGEFTNTINVMNRIPYIKGIVAISDAEKQKKERRQLKNQIKKELKGILGESMPIGDAKAQKGGRVGKYQTGGMPIDTLLDLAKQTFLPNQAMNFLGKALPVGAGAVSAFDNFRTAGKAKKLFGEELVEDTNQFYDLQNNLFAGARGTQMLGALARDRSRIDTPVDDSAYRQVNQSAVTGYYDNLASSQRGQANSFNRDPLTARRNTANSLFAGNQIAGQGFQAGMGQGRYNSEGLMNAERLRTQLFSNESKRVQGMNRADSDAVFSPMASLFSDFAGSEKGRLRDMSNLKQAELFTPYGFRQAGYQDLVNVGSAITSNQGNSGLGGFDPSMLNLGGSNTPMTDCSKCQSIVQMDNLQYSSECNCWY